MKDEIKEILVRFDFVKKEHNKLSYEPEDLLTREEMWLLYDYITNLQEQQNQFASTINELGNSNVNLQQRNIELVLERDRLKEENKRIFSKVNDDELLISNAMNYAEAQDYKSRNEKANTLLDELLERAYIDGEYILYDYSTSELLEVKQALEGEDKDE